MCLSLLWIGALGPSILPFGELCVIVWMCAYVCVCVHVALRALCWFCSAVSVTHWAGSVGVPWLLSCCVYSICLLPKNTQIYYPSLSPSFSLSINLSYLLLTSLDLSFQIGSCVVVRWWACRQPALVSTSAGGGIEFLSQPSSQPSFCLKNTFFSWMDIFTYVFLIDKIVEWETVGKIKVC